MGVSDRDRKILWGRSGNRCGLCRMVLVADRTDEDPEAVVGDEAHIAARNPGGPRYGECDPSASDAYDNLILLCKVHHKLVDDQVHEFTTQRLREVKSRHEAWVQNKLVESDEAVKPVTFDRDPSGEPVRLDLLRTGSDVWGVVAGAHSYRLGDLDDDGVGPEQLDLAAEFLQLVKDWGEVSSEVEDSGVVAVREAKQSLGAALEELRGRELLAFGGRCRWVVRGGIGPPVKWYEAVVQVVRIGSTGTPAAPWS